MKRKSDPRHRRRTHLIQELFTLEFHAKIKPPKDLLPIIKSLDKIDETIGKAAPLWPIEKINRIDLAILRLAVFELSLNSEPLRVIVDEAVELAKEYGSESSPSFVNGVLGKVIQNV